MPLSCHRLACVCYAELNLFCINGEGWMNLISNSFCLFEVTQALLEACFDSLRQNRSIVSAIPVHCEEISITSGWFSTGVVVVWGVGGTNIRMWHAFVFLHVKQKSLHRGNPFQHISSQSYTAHRYNLYTYTHSHSPTLPQGEEAHFWGIPLPVCLAATN